ncbi:MAG: 16S rRNA (cytosine(967)-C(5))-methyltransferase RsmB [Oxalobacter sp.]|nr:MAG: 16S rRNA (cytosine(967)-C(5))-methyltransferase RsmB [Oxalobacter sp.]
MDKRPLITVKKKASKEKVFKGKTPRADAPRELKAATAPTAQLDLKSDSLAYALLGAADAVARVKQGTALPEALTQVFSKAEMTPQARGAIQDLAYRTMRQLGMAETLLSILASKAPEPMLLHGLLCCALTLLLESKNAEEGKGYESFTVVDQAVTAAGDPNIVHAKGMVNAVLRRFLRERESLIGEAQKNPVAKWNYPLWWIEDVRAAYPRNWEAILAAGNAPPPLTLRVNVRMTSVAAYLQTLSINGMTATQVGQTAVRLHDPVPVSQIPGFSEGWVSVQDAAAQLAAPLLDIQEGMRVLDACAAPGGKTGHIMEVAQVDLLALDADAARLERIEENLRRLQLSAQVQVGDATDARWWDKQHFDRILADVPCTASGIVRRHPDIRWLRRKSDMHRLATLSAQILDNLWQMLRPGGKLLFVTCSLWPQESEGQAAAFAVRHNAIRLEAPGQLLPVAGMDLDHDGLFFALFQKQKE